MSDLDRLVPRLRPYASTIFGEMSALASQLGAVNLGQGFPDVDGPEELKRIAIEAIETGSGNQYPPAHGTPDLRRAVAEHQVNHYGLEVDPDTEVVIGTGASELIAAAMLALVDAGDEVVVLEPWFDLYGAAIAMAGGRRVSVAMQPPTAAGQAWTVDLDALAGAITDRTRMILVNSPHNPTGAMLSDSERKAVAELAVRHDLIVLADDAYQHIVFEQPHVPIATVPGMAERTITIGSGGKSFSFTGWKVGWASGPASLIGPVRVARQHLSYVSGGPFQPAIAAGLRMPRTYFTELAAGFGLRRDVLAAGLRELGMMVARTDGSYFVTTDVAPLGWESAAKFCQWLPHHAGVVAIPLSALCDDPESAPARTWVRWTFSKREVVIREALERMWAAGVEPPDAA